jgi:hypothetical protein
MNVQQQYLLGMTMKNLFGIMLFSASLCLTQNALTQGLPPSPIFSHTTNSDEWISPSLHVQKIYTRVLVVDTSVRPPQRIKVSSLSLNAKPTDSTLGTHTYSVQAVFKTLQEAADAAEGGDLIAVMPGTYAGFVLEDKPSAGDGRYIHFKAIGAPGDVVIIQGFNLAGHNMPRVSSEARFETPHPLGRYKHA